MFHLNATVGITTMPPLSPIWEYSHHSTRRFDKACADMVIAAPAINGSCLTEKHPHEHLEGADKFHLMHPDTNWQAGLEHAQKIGLGVMQYELITV